MEPGTFVLIAQKAFDHNGQHYEPGDRFIAHWSQSAPLQRQHLAMVAPTAEQHDLDDSPPAETAPAPSFSVDSDMAIPPKRPRGRPRKVQTDGEAPARTRTYLRRDLEPEA